MTSKTMRLPTWDRETKAFYYGLRIPLGADGNYSLFIPKARKSSKGIATATVEVEAIKDGRIEITWDETETGKEAHDDE